MYTNRSPFASIPPVVKNLILINVVMLAATFTLRNVMGVDIGKYLALYLFNSENFKPFQLVTHMFMHGGLPHLFFNMFALFMFGRVLESVWGPRRFLVYYFATGLGAAALHMLVSYLHFKSAANGMSPEAVDMVLSEGTAAWNQGKNFVDGSMAELNAILNTRTVGASGAVFGVLLAFGMLFPNTELMLLFLPVPIKAKYFVLGYGAIELYLGFAQPGSNVAHFAHLGGMIFGYFLIKYWNKNSSRFY
ncbi:rhomboid family intramembrane serine protease [Prolixibacteraceae bacterium JC049]|nr:rhomboid family intramembrane serine protease [Prolixibacteraceae bacterium JC049]